ncbi:MAG: SctK family type III secretion system sorting platform protein [Ramlibacter sp.]
MDASLDERLLSFNLLPSRWAHRQRLDAWARPALQRPCDAADERRLHRHLSASFLRSAQPGVVPSLEDPLLPVFLVDEATLDQLAIHCGLVILGPAIRRVILRDEVKVLLASIGEQGLSFARQEAVVLGGAQAGGWPVLPLVPSRAHTQAAALGQALLVGASRGASPPVAARALLRLPQSAADEPESLPPDLLEPQHAARLALATLGHLDPAWRSLFP